MRSPPEISIMRRGLLFVLSSPSGAGKTTLSKALLASDPYLKLSTSVTTRPKRPAEIEGRDYYFVDEKTFLHRQETGEFLESAQVFSAYYGTPKQPIEDALHQGLDVVFDIDWQGTQQLAEAARADLVSVFILPPSGEELERRLRGRSQDSEDIVQLRMSKAAGEMSHWSEYDYVIINNSLEDSLKALQMILDSERLKRHRQVGLTKFVSTMMRTLR